ncbi:MAG TPA: hypothetical protein VFF19_07135 [Reyranella sp.]|nr:hypothetical protein [Reyranella sp.]
MYPTVSPTSDRVRIEIRRGSEPAIGFDVALSEAGNLSSLAQACARAMGFSTFVAFNRLQRSPELWLTLALAGLRLALVPASDRPRRRHPRGEALARSRSRRRCRTRGKDRRTRPATYRAGRGLVATLALPCRSYAVFLTRAGYITASPWVAM